jgi:hypothetical protein
MAASQHNTLSWPLRMPLCALPKPAARHPTEPPVLGPPLHSGGQAGGQAGSQARFTQFKAMATAGSQAAAAAASAPPPPLTSTAGGGPAGPAGAGAGAPSTWQYITGAGQSVDAASAMMPDPKSPKVVGAALPSSRQGWPCIGAALACDSVL